MKGWLFDKSAAAREGDAVIGPQIAELTGKLCVCPMIQLERLYSLWHRIPIPDLLIAETALHHGLGVLHVDGDFDRITEVRPLVARRLG